MRLFIPVLALLSLSACATDVMHFTAISTKPIKHMNTLDSASVVKNVSGTDIQHTVILFPIGFSPDLQDAVKKALDKSDSDMLINVSAYRRSFWIPFIYGQNRYTVVGDAVRFQRD